MCSNVMAAPIRACLCTKNPNVYIFNTTRRSPAAGGNPYAAPFRATLVMQGIASTGVTLSRPNGNNDLVLTVTATGKTVTLKNELYQYYSGLTVSFADGVTWNQTQIEQMLLDQARAANGG